MQEQAETLLLKITAVDNWREFTDKVCDYQMKEFRSIINEVERHLKFRPEDKTDSASKKSRHKRHKKDPYTPPE